MPPSYLKKLKVSLVKGNFRNPIRGQVRSSKQVFEVFGRIKNHSTATLIAVFLSADLDAIAYDVLSVSPIGETDIPSSSLFGKGFLLQARYLILVHNHPSGTPEPTGEDKRAIKTLVEQGKIVDQRLLDFIIVAKPTASGRGAYWSLFDHLREGPYDPEVFS